MDHAGREIKPDDAGFEGTQDELNQATDDHGEQKGLVAGQGVDAVEDNDGEASGWARDAYGAAGNGGDDEAAKDAGNEAGQWGAPEAKAMPRQRGRATRKTTMDAGRSFLRCLNMG